MNDLSPKSYLDLANRIKDNSTLAQTYRQRKKRYSDFTGFCDQKCRTSIFCESTTQDNFSQAKCEGQYSPYDFANDFINSLLFTLEEPWVRKVDNRQVKKPLKDEQSSAMGMSTLDDTKLVDLP